MNSAILTSRSWKKILSVSAIMTCSILAAAGEQASAETSTKLWAVKTESSTLRLKIGDKVNIAVYERLDRAEDKWGAQRRPLDIQGSFIQRMEMSGERVVQEDESITIPFLGQVRAGSLTSSEFEKAVADAFEQAFHRPAFATLMAIEHEPIFIVGPVKNPGSYKYSPGMTVLHAIALAGGMERVRPESWQSVEAVREELRNRQTKSAASRLLARVSILRAERTATELVVPQRLVDLLGRAEATVLVEDAKALRDLVVGARRAREAEQRTAIADAETELQSAKERSTPIIAGIKLRKERFAAISSLQASGMATRGQLADAQGNLADLETREHDAAAATNGAKRKLELAKEELTRFELENKRQLASDISSADRALTENMDSLIHSRGVMDVIYANNPGKASTENSGAQTYEIIRRTANGSQFIPADEVTSLEPGDLVRLRGADETAAPSGNETSIAFRR